MRNQFKLSMLFAFAMSLLMLCTGLAQAADYDTDGIDDSVDICVKFYDPLQEDTDGDGIGDACDTNGATHFIQTIQHSSFSNPGGVAKDSSGNIYVADSLGLSLVKKGGAITRIYSGPVNDVAVNSLDEVYLTTKVGLSTVISKYDALTSSTTVIFSTDFNYGASGLRLTFDNSDVLYASSSWAVYRDPVSTNARIVGTGTPRGTGVVQDGNGGPAAYASFANINDIAFNGVGDLYILDSSDLQIRVVSGGVINKYVKSPTGYSRGLYFDQNNNLIVTNSSSNQIVMYDSILNSRIIAGSGRAGFSDSNNAILAELDYPLDITGDGNGNIYFTDLRNNSLRLLSDSLLDLDNDFIAAFKDNCNGVANYSQIDSDLDGLGDACDLDDDNDGLTDIEEATLNTNPLLADTDGDGLSDAEETKLQTNPSLKTDPLLADTDGDGLNDKLELDMGTDPLSDADLDGDTVKDAIDICPKFYDPLQIDSDVDGIGDACDDGVTLHYELVDTDSDFVADFLDNCVNIANTNQLDTDSDGQGDVCDADDDNDGLTDVQEASYGTNPLVDADLDGDGLSDADEILIYTTNHNNADTDSDGMPDGWEVTNSLDPKINDASQDADADGYWNIVEYLEGSSPQNNQSVPTSLYANVTGLSGSSSVELLVDGLPVSLNTNGIQAVPNIPANQGVYNVSLKTHPSNLICIVNNHLDVNANTEATNALDIVCRARKLGMEDFGFSYHRYNSLEDTPPVPSVINYVVKVRDQVSNAPVLGLISSDFLVKENGSAISPTESYLTSQPVGKLPYTYKLGVMIDISPSLSLADVADAKQAAIDLVNLSTGLNGRLKDNIQMAIWTFDGDVYSNQSYTDDAQRLLTAISSVQRSLDPSTNLNEAIKTGLESWFNNYDLNNLAFGSLIVITDGGDTSGVFSSAQVAALRGDKTIYALPVGAEASNSANIAALKEITGEVNNPNAEQKRIFPTANFAQLSAQLNSVVQQGARFFEGLYAIYYSSPKRANTHIASLTINQNTSCVPSASLACEISYEFDATEFGAVMPELVGNWPKEFLSSNSLALQVETRWSGDPANYTWTVLSADTGMSLTVDANDSSKVIITADPTSDETAITFEVEDNNYTGLSSLTYTVTAMDGVASNVDVCPSVFDPLQEDTDGDGVGDACQGSNAQALLDIDGSGQVNIYDLLMIQRYVGGVSSLTNNILLPTSVGGSGPNGEMTNIELRNNIAQLLASVSLDVNGDQNSDVYDLLMIQRYVGGIVDLTTNIAPVTNVGGLGAQGERTNTELRQAVFNIVGF